MRPSFHKVSAKRLPGYLAGVPYRFRRGPNHPSTNSANSSHEWYEATEAQAPIAPDQRRKAYRPRTQG